MPQGIAVAYHSETLDPYRRLGFGSRAKLYMLITYVPMVLAAWKGWEEDHDVKPSEGWQSFSLLFPYPSTISHLFFMEERNKFLKNDRKLPKSTQKINTQIHEAQIIRNWLSTQRHIIIKFSKVEDREFWKQQEKSTKLHIMKNSSDNSRSLNRNYAGPEKTEWYIPNT